MGKMILDDKHVLELYKATIEESALGIGSCAKVLQKLAEEGVVIPWTNRPPSRQAIRQSLGRSEEGRKLLALSRSNRWSKSNRYGYLGQAGS